MKIKTIKIAKDNSQIDKVVFFTETNKYDFVFNHILCLVDDKEDPEALIKASLYNLFPQKCYVTDRKIEVHITNKVQMRSIQLHSPFAGKKIFSIRKRKE